MNQYIRKGRVYPALVGMLIPLIVIFWSFADLIPKFQNNLKLLFSYLGFLGLSVSILAAIGYFLREVFRSISKCIFQFPFFREDETKMPTTEMLLWKNNLMSEQRHENISIKCYEMFNISLPSPQQENLNESQARLIIVDAVQQMRDSTRDNVILLQYNYEFGFCRNYLGAALFDIFFLVIWSILNCHFQWMPQNALWILGGIVLFTMLLSFISLKYRAKVYARALFTSFLNLKKKD